MNESCVYKHRSHDPPPFAVVKYLPGIIRKPLRDLTVSRIYNRPVRYNHRDIDRAIDGHQQIRGRCVGPRTRSRARTLVRQPVAYRAQFRLLRGIAFRRQNLRSMRRKARRRGTSHVTTLVGFLQAGNPARNPIAVLHHPASHYMRLAPIRYTLKSAPSGLGAARISPPRKSN
jgi:hypothetical protein